MPFFSPGSFCPGGFFAALKALTPPTGGGSPIGLLLVLTYATGSGGGSGLSGQPIGLLLSLTYQ